MIEPTEEPKLEDTALESKEKDTKEKPQPTARIVHTLADYTNPQIMKIEGFFEQQPINVPIGTGSTNNFMNSKVVTHLNLQKEDCSGFDIKVANGHILKCNQKSPWVKLIPQDQDVVVNFFHFLDDFEVVLDIDWLSTIEDVF
ncbi:hypothetical protein B296_00058507 [Ensete ventricosum]|uniref:Uncharacterized protein n=1 Tax=Ensete ventricosum TaxID=4639 RepID=A0A426XLY0_ENSVE|nr:hypothetical protein B296_00058507 [Ensete ventricosum]